MNKKLVNDKYFEWLYNLSTKNRFDPKYITYNTLFHIMYNRPFTYIIKKDEARKSDGLDLRYSFAHEVYPDVDCRDIIKCFDMSVCSIFEMLIALAIRCEDTIMANPEYGDRTRFWFWKMLNNLGISYMNDERIANTPGIIDEINVKLDKFVNREFAPDGTGWIFNPPGCEYDLRRIEIWTAMLWYLDQPIYASTMVV